MSKASYTLREFEDQKNGIEGIKIVDDFKSHKTKSNV